MKKILLVSRDMRSSGVQSSLLNLMKELVKIEDLDITLLLEEETGEYLKDIPNQIKVRKIQFTNKYYNYYIDINKAKEIFSRIDLVKFYFIKIFRKILLKLKLRKLFEFILIRKIEKDKTYYDLIIDFHGYGYYVSKYIAKYMNANKKIMFIHDEKIEWLENIKNYMYCFDKYCCVSSYVKNVFDHYNSQYKDKSIVIYNIIDQEKIKKLANEDIDIEKTNNKILLTIGRLEKQKGYDLLVDIACELKKDNINFIWYILGEGSLRNEIEKNITEKNLNNNIKLLGMKKNPYPYIKMCDIYVQPSKHEGFGIAVCEAKILERVVIATEIGAIKEQIDNGKDGYLCKYDKNEFKEKIEYILNNKENKKSIENNLKKFNYNNDIILERIINLI